MTQTIDTMDLTMHTVYASFTDAAQAEKAAGALLDYGVRPGDISIVSTAGQAEYVRSVEEFTSEGAPVPQVDPISEVGIDQWSVSPIIADYPDAHMPDNVGITTTTAADAASGAAKGASFGLGIGALAALACLAVPGVGLVVGGGALATAIAGAAGVTAAGAVAGGIHGFLVDQGVPDEEIHNYSEAFHSGDTIIAVTVPSNNVDEWTVDQVMAKYNGNHISSYRS